jgi:hypothetical protein
VVRWTPKPAVHDCKFRRRLPYWQPPRDRGQQERSQEGAEVVARYGSNALGLDRAPPQGNGVVRWTSEPYTAGNSADVCHIGSHQETAASRKEAKRARKLLLGMVAIHYAWIELLPRVMRWWAGHPSRTRLEIPQTSAILAATKRPPPAGKKPRGRLSCCSVW